MKKNKQDKRKDNQKREGDLSRKPLYLLFQTKYILLCLFLLSITMFLVFDEYIKTAMVATRFNESQEQAKETDASGQKPEDEYIKWMSFDVPKQVLLQALEYDVESYNTETPMNWVELLAYGAATNWGKFNEKKPCKEIDEAALRLKNGERMSDISKDLKLYDYYYEAYSAVLSGFVGEYEVEEQDPNNPGETVMVKKYGLKAFCPIAKGYNYSHYDDFGVSRSYGYKRKHQGNDLMGNVGTPVIAVEDGYVESLGWNQYGGWRVGIRSYDQKRYYYYAHLRKDHPFPEGLEVGDRVQAGDVIGYLGMTGYSAKENVNNIKTPHLHFGMQIIFDEVQKDGVNQIWIDVYDIVNLLETNKMPVEKNAEGTDYVPSVNINTIPTD